MATWKGHVRSCFTPHQERLAEQFIFMPFCSHIECLYIRGLMGQMSNSRQHQLINGLQHGISSYFDVFTSLLRELLLQENFFLQALLHVFVHVSVHADLVSKTVREKKKSASACVHCLLWGPGFPLSWWVPPAVSFGHGFPEAWFRRYWSICSWYSITAGKQQEVKTVSSSHSDNELLMFSFAEKSGQKRVGRDDAT